MPEQVRLHTSGDPRNRESSDESPCLVSSNPVTSLHAKGLFMKAVFLLFAGLALISLVGCSSMTAKASRTLTVEEVAAMTSHGVGAEVIKKHIEATCTQFDICSEEIIRLKKAGVSDDVIAFMIDSGNCRGFTTFDQNLAIQALYDQ